MEYAHGFDVLGFVVVISSSFVDTHDTFTHTTQGYFTQFTALVRGQLHSVLKNIRKIYQYHNFEIQVNEFATTFV